LDQTQRKESTDTGLPTSFPILIIRRPQITLAQNANGTTTVNTYDPAKLYRLTNKVTTAPGGIQTQNLAYTYDALEILLNCKIPPPLILKNRCLYLR